MDITKPINTISFFKGYGGIERGVELTGERIRPIASCEIEAYAIANLVAKMEEGSLDPHPIWTNAKTFPGEQFLGKVDLFTGGFPCQPFSAAGGRKADEDPRHLWPACIRAIDQFRPQRVLFENVEGLISAKLGGDGWSDPKGTPVLLHVCRELERRGYKTTWGVFSASEAGAPHQRKRVFILGQLANSEHNGYSTTEEPRSIGSEQKERWLREFERVGTPQGDIHIWPTRPGEPQGRMEEPRTQPKLGGAVDGINHRVDRLRLLGNGVVPQTAAIAWTVLNERLNQSTQGEQNES